MLSPLQGQLDVRGNESDPVEMTTQKVDDFMDILSTSFQFVGADNRLEARTDTDSDWLPVDADSFNDRIAILICSQEFDLVLKTWSTKAIVSDIIERN